MIIAIKRIAAYVRSALALLGLIVVVVTVTPVLQWWTQRLAGPWDDPQGEVLIVLAAEAHDDVIGESSYWRSVYAIRCWREGWVKRILLSGGAAGGPVPIAERMKQFLTGSGVPEEMIQVETRSGSTRENALFSKPLLDGMAGRKVLLTSDYHAFRAARAFEKAGISVAPRPFPDALKRFSHWNERWSVAQVLLIETVKVAVYRIRGWI